jgi:hypothetical protein
MGARTCVHSRLSSALRSAAFGGKLLCSRHVEIGLPLIDLARGDGAALGELLGPAGVGGGEHHLGLRPGDIGLGAIDRDLIGSRIDDEEKVAFFNELAVGKIDLV